MIVMFNLLIFILLSLILFFLPIFLGDSKAFIYPKLPIKLKKKINLLEFKRLIISICFVFSDLFKDFVKSDFQVFILWTQGFILFLFGVYLWALENHFSYIILTDLSILWSSLSLFLRARIIKTDFDIIWKSKKTSPISQIIS